MLTSLTTTSAHKIDTFLVCGGRPTTLEITNVVGVVVLVTFKRRCSRQNDRHEREDRPERDDVVLRVHFRRRPDPGRLQHVRHDEVTRQDQLHVGAN